MFRLSGLDGPTRLRDKDFLILGDQPLRRNTFRLRRRGQYRHDPFPGQFLPPDAIMVRRLKHHEAKLLRKTDFIEYKSDKGHRDADVRRRYMIQKPEDYVRCP